jgi:hypothetical protein
MGELRNKTFLPIYGHFIEELKISVLEEYEKAKSY